MKTIKIPYSPREYQKEIINDPHRFKIIVYHRQAGKTTTAINILNKAAITDPGTYLYIAPQKSQAKNIIWKAHDGIFKYVPTELIAKRNEVELTIYYKSTGTKNGKAIPGSIFFIEGSENVDRIRGLRPKGVIFDEYDQISEELFETIVPALIQNGGWAIFIGTFKGKGKLYNLFSKYWDWSKGESIEDPAGLFKAFYLPYYKNPFFTKKQEEEARAVMSPSLFDQEYGCIPMAGNAAVFENIHELLTGYLKEPNPRHYYVMGVDLAKKVDFTSVSIIDRNTHELVYQEKWQAEWTVTMQRILELQRKYNKAHIVMDSTGVGDPITEMLRKRGIGGTQLEDFKFSQSSKDQLVKKMSLFFSEKKIVLPSGDQISGLVDELEQFMYEILPSGKMRYSAPEGMHDDEVMSLGLAMWYLRDNPITDEYSVSRGYSQDIQLDPFA